MQPVDHKSEAWYRNPWVWLIIAIPGLTIVGCVVTIYLAVTNPDVLVSAVSTGQLALAGMTEAPGLC